MHLPGGGAGRAGYRRRSFHSQAVPIAGSAAAPGAAAGEAAAVAVEPAAAAARRSGYRPIEEQLDMLWHAMDQGSIPKAEPFYSTLQAVKQQSPKS